MTKLRNSHRRFSLKNGVLRNFVKLAEKTCARVSFLIKTYSEHLETSNREDINRLKHTFNKNRIDKNWSVYRNQQNLLQSIWESLKFNFSQLNVSLVSHSKVLTKYHIIWKCKDKRKFSGNQTIFENYCITSIKIKIFEISNVNSWQYYWNHKFRT